MAAAIQRLNQDAGPSLRHLLEQDPTQNLFLLGFLEAHPMDRAWWYGHGDAALVQSTVMLLPGRLAVPFSPDPTLAAEVGAVLQRNHRPCMLVGPRDACDALWTTWATDRVRPRRWYDQRLYVCTHVPNPDACSGFRLAVVDDVAKIAHNSGLMEEEDLGRNPWRENPRLHEQTVGDRVRAGRTWVIDRGGEILFQINVGTVSDHGCQVGGTYVPPAHRGQGLATGGMRALCAMLLRKHPLVTLHVNEANTAAVQVYEKSGFARAAPFRLVTVND